MPKTDTSVSLTSPLTEMPFVSVIMPVRDEAKFIERSLGNVLGQDYPADRMEVIIVDGMSVDGTRDIIAGLQKQHPNLRLIDNPAQIVPPAMNLGLACAKGDIVVRIDGHALIDASYVSEAVETLLRTGADMVGGPMRPYGDTPVRKAVAIAMSTPFGVGGGRFHYLEQEEVVDTVYIGIARRELYLEMGGFDEEMVRAQDAEFSARIQDRGGKIVCNPKIKSRYYPRPDFGSLARQQYKTGFWKVRVLQKHPGRFFRQLVPPIFVGALLISLAAAPFSKIGLWSFAFIGGSYVLANLAASFISAKKAGWDSLPLLPLTFAVLHLSYGFGFLLGLIRFMSQWGKSKPKGSMHAVTAKTDATPSADKEVTAIRDTDPKTAG